MSPCESCLADESGHVLLLSSILFDSYNPPLPWGFLISEGRNSKETSNLEISLHNLWVWFSVPTHLCCWVKPFLWWWQSIDLWLYQSITQNYLISFSFVVIYLFVLSIVIGSNLSLRAIQSLVPAHFFSVGYGLHLTVWVLSWTNSWLANPTGSVPPLSQNILPAGQSIDGRFCSWVVI